MGWMLPVLLGTFGLGGIATAELLARKAANETLQQKQKEQQQQQQNSVSGLSSVQNISSPTMLKVQNPFDTYPQALQLVKQSREPFDTSHLPASGTNALNTAWVNVKPDIDQAVQYPRTDAERWGREIDPARMREYVASILRDQFEQYRRGVPGDKLLSARVIGDLMQTYAALGGKYGELGQTTAATVGRIAEQLPAQRAAINQKLAEIMQDERNREIERRQQERYTPIKLAMELGQQQAGAEIGQMQNYMNYAAQMANRIQGQEANNQMATIKMLLDLAENPYVQPEARQEILNTVLNSLSTLNIQNVQPSELPKEESLNESKKYAQGGLVTPSPPMPQQPTRSDVQRYQQYMMTARKMGAQPIPLQEFLAYVSLAQAQPAKDDVPALIDGTQPAELQTGEFVLPKDVVMYHGLKSINKLIEQARRGR